MCLRMCPGDRYPLVTVLHRYFRWK